MTERPRTGKELAALLSRWNLLTDDERQRMVALHARSLSFWNPVSRAVMTFVAPLPEYWPQFDVKPPEQSQA